MFFNYYKLCVIKKKKLSSLKTVSCPLFILLIRCWAYRNHVRIPIRNLFRSIQYFYVCREKPNIIWVFQKLYCYEIATALLCDHCRSHVQETRAAWPRTGVVNHTHNAGAVPVGTRRGFVVNQSAYTPQSAGRKGSECMTGVKKERKNRPHGRLVVFSRPNWASPFQ